MQASVNMLERVGCSKRSLTCGRLASSNKPFDARRGILIVSSLFICLTMFSAQTRCLADVTGATTSDRLAATSADSDSQLPGESLTSEQKLLMSTRLPRQHFRLSVMPSASKSNFKLVKIQRSRASKKSSPTGSSSGGASTPSPERAQRLGGSEKLALEPGQWAGKKLPKGQGKKISGAVLRKLLNQTLPKVNASNTHSASGPENKGPAFKFVFIQRATQPPASGSQRATSEPAKTRQPSLAANVSRQLAHSLLYSAATLVDNLSSVSNVPGATLTPSQSTLAASNQQQDDPSNLPATSSSTSKPASSPESSDVSMAASEQQQQPSTSTKSRPTRKPRPSKIYNLPVKFVANGQPNHVMFHTIKQHFATIKRLQQSVSAQSPLQAPSANPGATKRKKTHKQNDRTRSKGKNSRLIHLPLKYLSNARPNLVKVIMGTTARSGSTFNGTSVSPSS